MPIPGYREIENRPLTDDFRYRVSLRKPPFAVFLRAAAFAALPLLLVGACQLTPGSGDALASQSPESLVVIPLSIDYTIEEAGNDASRPGKPGDSCRTGDVVRLSITTGGRCRLMVFSVDSMMIPQPVYPDVSLAPVPFSAGTMSIPVFLFGEMTGTEIYYAVASREDFTFDDIVPFLDTTLSSIEKIGAGGRTKASAEADYALRVPPRKFTAGCIHFRHLPGPVDSASTTE